MRLIILFIFCFSLIARSQDLTDSLNCIEKSVKYIEGEDFDVERPIVVYLKDLRLHNSLRERGVVKTVKNGEEFFNTGYCSYLKFSMIDVSSKKAKISFKIDNACDHSTNSDESKLTIYLAKRNGVWTVE
tara:strand:+ start:924 stop:1313 length:390 start_codon:yes stop_codon:yes gene_type:complete